ncbi:alpha/beta hydrolase-fold protein [Porticoccaceae bacterium]|nr:alpha/beta hydrolase-fold protein [Porticoccaceae bacterium]
MVSTPSAAAPIRTLASKHLQENRHYQVLLPDSYHRSEFALRHYPTVYLLDGQWHSALAWAVIQHLSASGWIPELILVAIDTGSHRFRDLTPTASLLDWRGLRCESYRGSGGLRHFLGFMQDELLPSLAADYRTAPHRSLVGHSLGGLAVSHSLLTQPDFFQGLVSIDASLWWDQQHTVNELASLAQAARGTTEQRYFYGWANYPADDPQGLAVLAQSNRRFTAALQDKGSAAGELGVEYFDRVGVPAGLNGRPAICVCPSP